MDGGFFECPYRYARFYCRNGGRCFVVYNNNRLEPRCHCTANYFGQRCTESYDTNLIPINDLIDTPEIALITVLTILIVALIILGIVYCLTRNKK